MLEVRVPRFEVVVEVAFRQHISIVSGRDGEIHCATLRARVSATLAAMAVDVPLKCSCGAVRGVLLQASPENGTRIVCHCDDCQAFAHFLGRADEMLDGGGGTDIYQSTPAQLRITEGAAQLRCMRLSPKGMFRWYAGCCNTPVGNMLAPGWLAFVGIPQPFLDHEGGGSTREGDIGPVLAHTQARFASGPVPEGAHPSAPFWLIVRTIRLLLRGIFGGKQRPSPFLDANGKRIADVRVLSREECERLRAVCGPQR